MVIKMKKTQKDILIKCINNNKDSKSVIQFQQKERQEAIKYIKNYENIKLPDSIPKKVQEYGKSMVIDFIKHYFNIE